jgi:hypothetical protein
MVKVVEKGKGKREQGAGSKEQRAGSSLKRGVLFVYEPSQNNRIWRSPPLKGAGGMKPFNCIPEVSSP